MKINGRSYTHYIETQLGVSQAAVNKMLLKVKKLIWMMEL